MTSAELNSLIESTSVDGKPLDRKRLGALMKISHPTLRNRLRNPELFSIAEINKLGKIIRRPKLISKFIPKI